MSMTATDDVPKAVSTREISIPPDGDVALRVFPVAKLIGANTFRMLSYGGSIPGPTLRVRQGTRIAVHVTNETEMETTVHWHGLRLKNEYDGVPHETQAPIAPGGTYTHQLTFPDAGLFWYHPHMREDYAQEMGLYGNVIVDPADESYWPKADRELVLTLDDILIEGDVIASFDPHHATFAAMGRFGNVLLTAGGTDQEFELAAGQVVRLMFTNTANTRVFKVTIPGARMKLIGGDGGRFERESWVEDVMVAPSERAIVDVLFERAGQFTLEHVTPERRYPLGDLNVSGESQTTAAATEFDQLRVNDEMVRERDRARAYLDAPPDKTLALVAEMEFDEPAAGAAVTFVCPMHADVTSAEPGSCPKCGMKLMPMAAVYACPMHPDVIAGSPGHCPKCGMKLMPSSAIPAPAAAHDQPHEAAHGHHDHSDAMAEGIEWEDMMVDVNRRTTSDDTRWKLIDRDSGKANEDIDWEFAEGDQVKIRLVNEMESDHPMHHPFHIHGQRFLVLTRDEHPEDNLVWKDTALLRTGEIVDILMDASNPGLWMAHCHIA
jgi:FtsP/CotA-like multicopper oxidase with cupredoxin domain